MNRLETTPFLLRKGLASCRVESCPSAVREESHAPTKTPTSKILDHALTILLHAHSIINLEYKHITIYIAVYYQGKKLLPMHTYL